MAHLATRSGRTSDVRYGYTKIANPWYLWRKSVISNLTDLVVRYWIKTTVANIVRMMMPKQPQSADYRKRLHGNLMAYRDLLLWRLDPLNILEIPESPGPSARSDRGRIWGSATTNSTGLNSYSGGDPKGLS